MGSAERGRSMFESCLRNYPARLDVWSQYLDQVSSLPVQSLRPVDSMEIRCNFSQFSVFCTCWKKLFNIQKYWFWWDKMLYSGSCEASPMAWMHCLQRAKTKSGLERLPPCWLVHGYSYVVLNCID